MESFSNGTNINTLQMFQQQQNRKKVEF